MRRFLAPAAVLLAPLPCFAQATGVEATPTLTIRAESDAGVVQLDAPLAATRTRDGRIVVAEQTALRVFDRAGRLSATVGRAGQGPGEFRRVFWVSSCGTDSVFVFDLPRGSIDVLTPGGALTVGINLREALPQGAGGVTAVACAQTGSRFAVLAGPTGLAEVAPGIRRGTSQMLAAERGTWRFAAGATVPSQEFVMLGGGAGPRPLGRNTSIGFAGDELVVGTADSAGVLRLGANGGVRPLRVPLPPRPVTAAMRERAGAELLDMVPGPMRPQMRQLISGLSWPTEAPPYLRVVASSTDELWLELPAVSAGTTELVGVGADGGIRSRITLPVSAHSVEVGAAEVLVVANDADGVPSVLVYRRR